MFIIRNLLSPSARRRQRVTCTRCEAAIYRFERWCPFCLAGNPTFSRVVFARVADSPFEEARAYCRLDPNHELERLQYDRYRRSRPSLPTLAGCSICRTRLP
jgi:hypothetical protein